MEILYLEYTKNHAETFRKIDTKKFSKNINNAISTLMDGEPYFFEENPIKEIDIKKINLDKIYDQNVNVFFENFKKISNIKENNKFFIGGNHFISYLIIKRLYEIHKKKISVICFDAHHDLWDETPITKKYTNGTWLRRLIEENIVDAEKTYLLGIRSVYTKESKKFIKNNRINIIHPSDLKTNHIQIFEKLVETLKETPCYFSFDMDCLDPSISDAVLFPEPNGLDMNIIFDFFKTISNDWFDKKINILGFDFVEYCPNLDKNCISAIHLMHIILYALCYEKIKN